MAIVTHVAAHPDQLVASLCAQLATPGDDPFTREVVAVPTRGIERWLTQRIASGLADLGAGDGICANIDFPSPARLVRDVLASVPEPAAAVAAWEGPGLTAHLLDAIDTHLDQPWMRLLQRHVVAAAGANRLPAAVKIARLFTGYARRRPEMVRAWAAGADVAPDGSPLPAADRWQPALWRITRRRIGVPALPELLPEALDAVSSGELALDLPRRLAVYGLTAADPLDLGVLLALASQRDLHLHVLHPSPRLWEETAAAVGGPATTTRRRRTDDPTADLAVHPLLRSWAQDSRELQVVLAGHGVTAVPSPAAAPPPTVLGRLQGGVLGNRPAGPLPGGAAGDRSVQIHVCHGARRQVEVMRDAVLHALAADPTLEPRHVVIMTPDLATFAPLLEAAFPADGGEGGGVPDLRLRIADRSPAATNPLVRFVATVLDLADSRLEAGLVRDLVTRPVVQERFGFDADTAAQIIAVIDDAHIAWGLDGADRERWGAGSGEQRTWRRGLDRALAGVFYADSAVRVVAATAPLDGVEGQEAVPVGHLASLVDRIAAIRRLLGTPMPFSRWAAAIADSVRMLALPAWGDEWQWEQLERLLADTFPTPGVAADPLLGLGEARRAVAGWVDDRPSPLHFRTGDVTVCTLAPMRSVPYRVMGLLGMDDERFPRSSRSDGDDLLVGHELVGDHDRGAQDRQLLLDAVMAAGDHLIVTYSGRDELTGARYPPAVPVAELIDTLGEMLGDEGAKAVVTRHPLQSFSEVNFIADRLGVAGPWGYDPMQLAGAVSGRRRGTAPPPQPVSWPAPPGDGGGGPIRLVDLIGFLAHPARRFLRSRLGFAIPEAGGIPDDTLPADLDPLARWAITERLLSGLIAGHDLARLAARERHRDALPPGSLGDDDLNDAVASASDLWDAARARGFDPSRLRPLSGVVRAGGHMIEGSVEADPEQAQIATVTPSRLKAKQRLDGYTRLVFLSALDPETPWRVVLMGRRDNGTGHVAVTMGPLSADAGQRGDDALHRLAALVELYEEGHLRPIPMPCETSYLWQRRVGGDRGRAYAAARDTWETGRFAEANDPAHLMVLEGSRTMNALLDAGFEDYCARLWAPIIPLSREVAI